MEKLLPGETNSVSNFDAEFVEIVLTLRFSVLTKFRLIQERTDESMLLDDLKINLPRYLGQ